MPLVILSGAKDLFFPVILSGAKDLDLKKGFFGLRPQNDGEERILRPSGSE